MPFASKGARRIYDVAYRFRRRILKLRKRVELSLTPEEHLAFAKIAQTSGNSVAKTITALANAQLNQIPQKPILTQEDRQLFRSVFGQLGKLGSNLNQAMRAWNRRPDDDPDKEHMLLCLTHLHKQLATVHRNHLMMMEQGTSLS